MENNKKENQADLMRNKGEISNTSEQLKKFDMPVKNSKKKLSPEQVIRALLLERNWKQSELAEKIGLTRQALNNYLRGFWIFPTSIKIKISQAFGIDSSVIWDLEERK